MTESSTAGVLRRATLKGVATMFPVFLTVAALLFAWSILSGFLKPIAALDGEVVYADDRDGDASSSGS